MLTPTNNPPKKWERFKTAFVFVLWGSPIGAIPIILLFAFTGKVHPNLIDNIMGTIGIAFYSYMPGIIPALITGLIYQWWLYRPQPGVSRTREVLAGFVIGYCATATLLFLLFSVINPDIEMSIWSGLIGGWSGAMCAYLDKRRRRKMHAPPDVEITEARVPLFPK